MTNAKVICAGCGHKFPREATDFYRKKRCCGLGDCLEEIDRKIKHANYKKQRRKYEKGTHRRGLDPLLRTTTLNRDGNCCVTCFRSDDELQIHHIVPVSKGGKDDILNLVTLCKQCHVQVHKNGEEKYAETFQALAKGLESIGSGKH